MAQAAEALTAKPDYLVSSLGDHSGKNQFQALSSDLNTPATAPVCSHLSTP